MTCEHKFCTVVRARLWKLFWLFSLSSIRIYLNKKVTCTVYLLDIPFLGAFGYKSGKLTQSLQEWLDPFDGVETDSDEIIAKKDP